MHATDAQKYTSYLGHYFEITNVERLTRRVSLVEQELPTLPEHLSCQWGSCYSIFSFGYCVVCSSLIYDSDYPMVSSNSSFTTNVMTSFSNRQLLFLQQQTSSITNVQSSQLRCHSSGCAQFQYLLQQGQVEVIATNNFKVVITDWLTFSKYAFFQCQWVFSLISFCFLNTSFLILLYRT